jgi:hypothetical protein
LVSRWIGARAIYNWLIKDKNLDKMSRESVLLISENDWQGFLMSVQRSLREEQGEEEKEGST